jgi:hypothetical protein
MPFKPSTERASRGKSEEKSVKDFLEAYDKAHAKFDFLRLPDARAAGGRMASMPGDFEYFMPLVHGLIEVKAVDHEYRIAKDKVAQLPRLAKRELAGGSCFILIHHTPNNTWRILRPGQLEFGVPSWDLRDYPTFDTAESALLSTGVFG